MRSSTASSKSRTNSLRSNFQSFRVRTTKESQTPCIAPKYNSANSLELFLRLNASVWPRVLPWCIVNTAMACSIHFADRSDYFWDLSTKDKAHVFMSVMVSFLVVTRSRICLNRYMYARSGLSDMTRASKELVQHAVAFTRYTNPGEVGKKWRGMIATRTISLLKIVVAILQFPTKRQMASDLRGIPKEDRAALSLAVGNSNERCPQILTLFLRAVIASHEHELSQPLQAVQELHLHALTADFLTAYTNIMSYVNTPYPFPLVQMTRTFLFLYVFSLPFALADDIKQLAPYLLVVFFFTYGFIGLELISIEMDDPFGDDPNDFNVEAMARSAYEDIKVLIEDIDGFSGKREVLKAFEDDDINDRLKNELEDHRVFIDFAVDHATNEIQVETLIDEQYEFKGDGILGDVDNGNKRGVGFYDPTALDLLDDGSDSFRIIKSTETADAKHDNSSIGNSDDNLSFGDDNSNLSFDDAKPAARAGADSKRDVVPPLPQVFQRLHGVDDMSGLPSPLSFGSDVDTRSLGYENRSKKKSKPLYKRLNPRRLVLKSKKKKNANSSDSQSLSSHVSKGDDSFMSYDEVEGRVIIGVQEDEVASLQSLPPFLTTQAAPNKSGGVDVETQSLDLERTKKKSKPILRRIRHAPKKFMRMTKKADED